MRNKLAGDVSSVGVVSSSALAFRVSSSSMSVVDGDDDDDDDASASTTTSHPPHTKV
jgi:hypothetical protein